MRSAIIFSCPYFSSSFFSVEERSSFFGLLRFVQSKEKKEDYVNGQEKTVLAGNE